jgi:hypothetical protein
MISRMRFSVLMALTCAGLCLGGAPLTAQVRQGPPAPEARQRLERQVRERFAALIRTELNIDEATATRLQGVMESFMVERRELSSRRAEVRRRMRSSGTLLDDASARTVLDDLVRVQRDEVDLLAREQAALLDVLSAPQLVRFYTLQENLAERIGRLRGAEPPMGRRGGGGPGAFPGVLPGA